ncbi:hypothetical protein [Streptomyces sp. NPDC001820]|uniref:hypothetical protein n=1 Tax=Streptomyces sp. NPDC001820 TaxID=3364613 RepID=UPI00367AEF7D
MTTNDYTCEQSPDTIRAIFLYHVQGQGWKLQRRDLLAARARRGGNSLQGVVEASGEPCVRGGQSGERLGERSARALRRPADEAPDRQPDHKALFS